MVNKFRNLELLELVALLSRMAVDKSSHTGVTLLSHIKNVSLK